MNSALQWVALVSEVWGRDSFERAYRALELDKDLIRLGSDYGGWVVNELLLDKGLLISAGIGEDISFEIEVLSRYEVDVLAVDPTPRAKKHLTLVAGNWGRKETLNYGAGGLRSIAEYNLSRIDPDRFFFCDAAIGGRTGFTKLYFPKNEEHVSLSCLQNSSSTSEHLVANTVTVSDLMRSYKAASIGLLKLDVEGAEVETLLGMLDDLIFPTQLCVEFDSLRLAASKMKDSVCACFKRLRSCGYRLRWVDSTYNCLLQKDGVDFLCVE